VRECLVPCSPRTPPDGIFSPSISNSVSKPSRDALALPCKDGDPRPQAAEPPPRKISKEGSFLGLEDFK